MKMKLHLFVLITFLLAKALNLWAQPCASTSNPWLFQAIQWWDNQPIATFTPTQVNTTTAPGYINFLAQAGSIPPGYGGKVTLNDTLCINNDFTLDVRLRNRDNATGQEFMAYDAIIRVTLDNNVTFGCKLVDYSQAWAYVNTELYYGSTSVSNDGRLAIDYNNAGLQTNGFNTIRLRLNGNALEFSQVAILGLETSTMNITYTGPVCKTITKIEIWFKGAGEVDLVRVRNNANTITYLNEDFTNCSSYAQFPSCTEPVYNLSYTAPTCNLNRLQLNLNSTPTDSTSYSWVGPNGFTSTLKNPFINFPTTVNQGTYTVTIRPKNPCLPTYTRSINVTFPTFPLPQTFTRMLCPGETFTLPSGTVVSQAGTYNDTLASSIAGCDSIIITNITLGNVTARTDTILCNPGVVPLNATSNGFGYLWSPSTGLSDSLIANPTATINSSITYTVTSALPNFNAPNLVQNPGFEAGNVQFTSNYTFSTTALTANSLYGIGANPNSYFNQFANCTPRTGIMMAMFNGFQDSTYSLWCQTIAVQPNTFYDLGFWAQSIRNSGVNAELQIVIDGVNVGPRMIVTPATCNWQSYSTAWFSGAATSISFCIRNVSNSNDPDFALDDIWFKEMCTFTDQVNIIVQQPAVSISNIANVSCFGGNDGTATANAVGIAPFTYLWSNGETTATATGLTEGTFIVTVTDSVGCEGRDTIIITEPTQLTVTLADTTNISCFGLTDGSVRAIATGGVAPYTYSWNSSPVQNSNVLQNVPAGSYTITVTDSNSCNASANVTLTEPTQLSMNFSNITDVSCFGGNDGTAEVAASGGSPSYVFEWDNNVIGNQNTSLTGGWHTVELIDGNNCSIIDSVFINQPPVFSAFANDSNSVTCFGMNDGAFEIGVIGGFPNFTYTVNGQTQSSVQVDSLLAGSYTVVVTDANGCTATFTHTVTQPDSVYAEIDADPTMGLVPTTVNFTSNSTGYSSLTWMLNNGVLDTTNAYSHLFTQPGEYEVLLIATNENGCTDTAKVMIFIADSVHAIFPNVITPNGDGSNDFFDVKQSGVKAITIVIYNRWGTQIYSNFVDNITSPVITLWDGKTAVGGNECSEGTYYFDAVLEDLNGKKSKAKGFVHLFR